VIESFSPQQTCDEQKFLNEQAILCQCAVLQMLLLCIVTSKTASALSNVIPLCISNKYIRQWRIECQSWNVTIGCQYYTRDPVKKK